MNEDKITFLGKSYALARVAHEFSDKGTSITVLPWRSGGGYSASLSGKLFNIDICVDGETPQAAADKLEKAVLREFKKIAAVLGYDVEG